MDCPEELVESFTELDGSELMMSFLWENGEPFPLIETSPFFTQPQLVKMSAVNKKLPKSEFPSFDKPPNTPSLAYQNQVLILHLTNVEISSHFLRRIVKKKTQLFCRKSIGDESKMKKLEIKIRSISIVEFG